MAATRRLVQAEGRALVVAAQLEAAEPGDGVGLLLPLLADVLDGAAEFTHLGDRGVDVVDAEEEIRGRALVTAVQTE
ncbi:MULTISPECIES: hypothetical protein [Streptomyces]|uniref:hypothetical protein n=1 Tax=Streptomyces TaxID=1883 RepID=UPI0014887D2D|nr:MULTISPECIES: hypothetical protein [Streptomyces]